MTSISLRRICAAIAGLAVASGCLHALAASQRTFVALSGVDSGACGAAAPCRTLAFALGQTVAGGEVVAIESGGYGPATIVQSVSITAPDGIEAGITGFTGNAITVNGAAARVVIRGFALSGLGADNGVSVLAAASVRVDRCTISGFAADGIVGATGGGQLVVEHSQIRDNLGGIVVGGTHRLVVDDTTIENNGSSLNSHLGISLTGSTDVTIRGSRVRGNAYGNILVNAVAGDTARIEVTDSLLADSNDPGLYLLASGAGASIYAIAERNLVRNNFHGLLAETNLGGTVRLIAKGNTSTGNGGSWAYGAVGTGTTLVLSGNVAAQSLWGIRNDLGQATVLSTGDNIVQDAGIAATATPPALF